MSKGIDKVKRGLSNQAVGFTPLLVFLLADNYVGYRSSFIISIFLSLICTFIYRIFAKEKIFQFSLIPSATILFLYAVFLGFNISPLVYARSSLFIEILSGGVLLLLYLSRKYIQTGQIERKNYSPIIRTTIRNSLNEFFYLCKLFLGCYFVHFLFVIFFLISTTQLSETGYGRFLMDYMPTIIVLSIILYEQIRVHMVKESLDKETWLPVLNEKGRVIGSMAKSVSEQGSKKYIHPVIRIMVIHQGMVYLQKRKKDEYISPDLLDHPFSEYVLFEETIQDTVNRVIKPVFGDTEVSPRHMLNYTFENNKVKQIISLFLLRLENEEEVNKFHIGKLWTSRQIEENIEAHLFSEYFVQEYPYIQSTVLMIENIMNDSTDA